MGGRGGEKEGRMEREGRAYNAYTNSVYTLLSLYNLTYSVFKYITQQFCIYTHNKKDYI